MNRKKVVLLHVVIMYLTFLCGEWLRMLAFKTGLREPYDEFLSIFIDIGVILSVIWLYSSFILKAPLRKFMICKPLPRYEWCIIAFIIPMAILFFYLNCLDGVLQKNSLNQADMIYVVSYTFLRTGICAGIVEEIIFRGMIMNLLESAFSKKQAILFSSLLFASIHLSNIDISYVPDTILMLISTTIAGTALSFVAYETGSVWSGAVIHGMYNIITSGQILEIATEHNFVTIWNYTPDTRDILFTGGEFGITAGLPTVIGFLLIIIVIKVSQNAGL